MRGRRTLFPELAPLDLEINRTARLVREIFHPRAEHTVPVATNPFTFLDSPHTLHTPSTSPTPPSAMGDDIRPRQLKEYYTPSNYVNPSPIKLPEVIAGHYEIKSHILQMVPSYHGLSNENPYHHLNALLNVCSTFKLQNIPDDVLRLILFPFSLKDKAKDWLDSLTPNSIDTWAQMENAFLKKYFPIGKTHQMRRAITSFAQLDGEALHETWERLKDLTRQCPHHNVPRWQLVQCFYDGLNERQRQFVDASCGGSFMMKNEDEAWELFDNLSENSTQHALAERAAFSTPSPPPKKGGIYEITPTTDITCKVDALCRQMNQLMSMGLQSQRAPTPPHHSDVCTSCFVEGHVAGDCPAFIEFSESGVENVNLIQPNPSNNPYSGTYNPGWKNHPNFSYKTTTPIPYGSQPPFPPPQRAPYQNYNNNNYPPPQRPPF